MSWIEDRGGGSAGFSSRWSRGTAASAQARHRAAVRRQHARAGEACTDNESSAGRPTNKGAPEDERVGEAAYHIATEQADGAVRVSCADKLHNTRAILREYEVEGEKLLEQVIQTSRRTEQLSFYEGLRPDAFRQRSLLLGDDGLDDTHQQLAATVEAIPRNTRQLDR